MTYMFILKCALKLVLKNILYYDARSEKHHITSGFAIVLYNLILTDLLTAPDFDANRF